MTRIARQDTAASPREVWNVLSDGWRYAAWVVGASRIRRVDAAWPDVGSRICHSVGMWPVLFDDYTEVLGRTSERELVLGARVRPFGRAGIRLTIDQTETGSHITMSEHITGGVGCVLPEVVQGELVRPRNQECLRRLAMIAERGTHGEAGE
ncbi:polyketide cyclase/dehydrase/lipid transport protein [Rhodococcus sp. SMB37]|uniref:SRPBCC family protein n=1 Tax=Rhodococcus sp. SMB37 TaxID=2512213 RepID=UPI0006D10BAF|nr:SRPBCC family protein [Rhodococcus sp. SMB37]TCN54220.1 polyketide cyclase/dehydrase/lipid transport protein [Rhodococcus sp. SMB37]